MLLTLQSSLYAKEYYVQVADKFANGHYANTPLFIYFWGFGNSGWVLWGGDLMVYILVFAVSVIWGLDLFWY